MNEKTRKLTKILIDDSIRNGFVDIEEDLSSFAFDIVMGEARYYFRFSRTKNYQIPNACSIICRNKDWTDKLFS